MVNCKEKTGYFDFGRLSSYRSALMGFAIIYIFLLHSGNTGVYIYDSIRKWGWLGVDIFFFLSALGLGFSLKKNVDNFMKRRIVRILPTWLVVLFIVHIIGLFGLHYLPDLPFNVPTTIPQTLTWYTGLGYWIANALNLPNEASWYYEWYIPTLLLFYSFTPFLYRRSNKTLLLIFVLSIIIGFYIVTHYNTRYLELSITRIPIFLMGILFFRFIDSPADKYKSSIFITVGLLCAWLIVNYIHLYFINIPKEYRVLFIIPLLCLLLSYISQAFRMTSILSFFGGISLELYLVHLYRRPNYLMSFLFNNKFIIIVAAFVLSTLVAYILHKVMSKVDDKLRRYIKL